MSDPIVKEAENIPLEKKESPCDVPLPLEFMDILNQVFIANVIGLTGNSIVTIKLPEL